MEQNQYRAIIAKNLSHPIGWSYCDIVKRIEKSISVAEIASTYSNRVAIFTKIMV